MFGFVAVGVVVNLIDAKESNISWAATSGFVTVLIVFIMFLSRPVWSGAVIARTPRDWM